MTAITAGEDHTCALLETGGVRCWGYRLYGRLGDADGTTSDSSKLVPPDFDVLTNVKAIAAGAAHTCALTEDGGVRCWGHNQYGQLGNDSLEDRAEPTDAVLTNVKSIAVGSEHTCALLNGGGVRCWGNNSAGQLGVETSPPHVVQKPPDVDLLTGVKAITAGGSHTCALMNSGDVRCWGASYHQGKIVNSPMPTVQLPQCHK